jgi:hypothetical protein
MLSLSSLRRSFFSLFLSLTPLFMITPALSQCATVGQKEVKKTSSKKKKQKDRNYDLYSNKNVKWDILKRGQDELGGAALDSY